MRGFNIYYAVLLSSVLAGCTSMPQLKLPQLKIEPRSGPFFEEAAPQGTAKELFRDAVDALQHGESEKARPLLRQVLVLEPDHKYASALLAQIDADPVQILGKENFPYRVQPGDTLSLISRRFLGDPFKFYILARYNDIVISDELEAGRSIKIPGKKPADKPVVAEQPQQREQSDQQATAEETSSLRVSEANALYKNQKFAEAIKVLENLRLETGSNAEMDNLLIAAYSSQAKKLEDAGRLGETNTLLSRASSAFPENEALKKQIEQVELHRNAERTYRQGNQWLAERQPQKAYAAYVETLKLEPEHAAAKAAMLKIKPQVVEAFYADSIRARRRQNLTEALESLDKLLEIDPNHKLAKTNRREVEKLLELERAQRKR